MGHYTETPAGRHYFFTLGYIRSTIIMSVGVVDGQPGKPNFGPYEAAPVNTREWQKGMCDCAEDCAWCCWTCCCTPCAAAQIAMRNDENCCVGCWLNTLGIQSVRTKMRIRSVLRAMFARIAPWHTVVTAVLSVRCTWKSKKSESRNLSSQFTNIPQ